VRAVVERVCRATVRVKAETVGQIKDGLLVYAAAAPDDTDEDVRYIADKVAHLRVFRDEGQKMNLDVGQAGGGVLVVSAFSVQADARQGRRPSFDSSAPAEVAEPLIDTLAEAIRGYGLHVETGRFRAYMRVAVVNDGPICILLDSRRGF
jgi:D-tyrosyl-tRNA(Tyr) deacylase